MVGAVVLVFLSACYAGRYGAGAALFGEWQRVSPPETGLALSMPGQPSVDESVDRDFDGTPIRATVGRYIAGDAALFGFIVIEAPGGFVHDPYASAREAATSGGDNESDEVVRLNEQYGANGFMITDRIIDIPADGVVLYMRMHVGKTRAYGTFLAFGQQNEAELKPVVDRYFGSVEIDPVQAVTPVGSGQLKPDRWEFIYPPEADFAVRMPGSARGLEGEESFDGDEVYVRRYGVASSDGTEVFEVVVTAFEDGPPRGVLDKAKGAWAGQGFRAREEHFTEVRGWGGRSLVFQSKDEVVHIDYYVTMTRMYEVRVRMPRKSEGALAQARRWFLESFRIF